MTGTTLKVRTIKGVRHPAAIEVDPEARWYRFDPFDFYQPTSRARQVEAGPHLTFLKLKNVLRGQRGVFDEALLLFANRYGFLGQFEREYLRYPALPEGRFFVAPEAIIDEAGRLKEIESLTEGRELVYQWQVRQGNPLFVDLPSRLFSRVLPKGSGRSKAEVREWIKQDAIIAPSEVKFVPRVTARHRPEGQLHGLQNSWQPSPWETIKRRFGGILVYDEREPVGVSVLCTREPHSDWLVHLDRFPSPDTAASEDLVDYISSVSEAVSPRTFVGEDGNLTQGWRCGSLLEAMGVMFLLDLTSDNKIRKCQSRGCPNYFRIGPQTKSKYCSTRCANRASTRIGRGQVP